MCMLTQFVLDTNVFIGAYRFYYAFDIAPGFWVKLLAKAECGIIVSIEQVLDEILRGHNPNSPEEPDELSQWATSEFIPYFERVDTEVITAYTDIVNWVAQSDSYSDAAKQEFASVADGWLIAYARAKEACLVTHEKEKRKGKVPIPDVCDQFGVEYINTYEMMRRIGLILE